MPETLWNGGPVLSSAPGVFPMGTDSVILADFAQPGRRDRVLDLGTGSGILAILMAYGAAERRVSAVELDPNACHLAEKNFSDNGLDTQIILHQRDLREYRFFLPGGETDLVISNPPYFTVNSGPDATSRPKNARGDATCSLEDLCQAAAWALRWGGRFVLCFRPERLCDLFCTLRACGLEPKRLRPVRHSAGKPVNLLLIEARRGGNPGLKLEQDLVLRSLDGSETSELQKIYHRNNCD